MGEPREVDAWIRVGDRKAVPWNVGAFRLVDAEISPGLVVTAVFTAATKAAPVPEIKGMVMAAVALGVGAVLAVDTAMAGDVTLPVADSVGATLDTEGLIAGGVTTVPVNTPGVVVATVTPRTAAVREGTAEIDTPCREATTPRDGEAMLEGAVNVGVVLVVATEIRLEMMAAVRLRVGAFSAAVVAMAEAVMVAVADSDGVNSATVTDLDGVVTLALDESAGAAGVPVAAMAGEEMPVLPGADSRSAGDESTSGLARNDDLNWLTIDDGCGHAVTCRSTFTTPPRRVTPPTCWRSQ